MSTVQKIKAYKYIIPLVVLLIIVSGCSGSHKSNTSLPTVTPTSNSTASSSTQSNPAGSSQAGAASSDTVKLQITSDPDNTEVYINGDYAGITPFTQSYPKGESIDYEVKSPNELQYHDFSGHLMADRNHNIAVFLPRLTQAEKPTSYTIVSSEDQSIRAMTKPLMSYTTSELAALPWDKKMLYRVVLPPNIKQTQVKPTVEKIIRDITSKDSDIDEITLFLYSDKRLANSFYDIGSATWALGGKLGNVTPRVAESNDRSSYQLTINVRSDLEAYLKSRNTAQVKFGLSEAKRKAIFKETVALEDKAQAEADKRYPMEAGGDNVRKNVDLDDALVDEYHNQIMQKYHLTKDVFEEIIAEGIQENWPMP